MNDNEGPHAKEESKNQETPFNSKSPSVKLIEGAPESHLQTKEGFGIKWGDPSKEKEKLEEFLMKTKDNSVSQEKNPKKAWANPLKKMVSGKKKRFQQHGFDLDLTYITKKVIAMGFPSSGAEALARNKMADVQRFFKERHNQKFMIFNL